MERARGALCLKVTCKVCVHTDLQRSIPEFALSIKWNVGVMPTQLSGLMLLITWRFHGLDHLDLSEGVICGFLPMPCCSPNLIC
jgi:hypothetical protein